MKKNILFHTTIATILFFLFCSLATAGQVVTPQLSKWAQEAIQQEKQLNKPPQPNSIAVLYFDNQTKNPRYDLLQKGLALMLTTDLAKVSGLQVMERARLQALIEELDLGQTVLAKASTSPRIGNLLAVQHLVSGRFSQGSLDELAINSDLFKLPSGKMVNQAEAKGLFADIFKLEKLILFAIIDALDPSMVTKEEREDLHKPLTNSLEALFAFFAGLEHSDNHNPAEAHKAYQRALQKDPGFELAHKAMLELEELGLFQKKRTRRLSKSLKKIVAIVGALAPENLRHERNPDAVDHLTPPSSDPQGSEPTTGFPTNSSP